MYVYLISIKRRPQEQKRKNTKALRDVDRRAFCAEGLQANVTPEVIKGCSFSTTNFHSSLLLG